MIQKQIHDIQDHETLLLCKSPYIQIRKFFDQVCSHQGPSQMVNLPYESPLFLLSNELTRLSNYRKWRISYLIVFDRLGKPKEDIVMLGQLLEIFLIYILLHNKDRGLNNHKYHYEHYLPFNNAPDWWMNDLFRKLNIKSFWADPPAVDIWKHSSTAN